MKSDGASLRAAITGVCSNQENHTMRKSNSKTKKTTESKESKPASIIIERDGDEDVVVDAAHHIVSDQKVLIYIDRGEGVDLTESLANCHICRSDAGLRAHRGDATSDTVTGEEPGQDAQADSEIIVGSLTGGAD